MFIDESFLSFVWQFRYFDNKDLRSSKGEPVTVIAAGYLNRDAGPDFSNATVKIGPVTWHGNVEIHVRASNWTHHKHHENPGFENVILHVVWEDDKIIYRQDRSVIPAIELMNRVDNRLLHKYHSLVESRKSIPCDPEIGRVGKIHIAAMLDKVLVERIKEKSEYALELLSVCNFNWEEMTYRLLSKNFGFKINQHPMLAMATYLPFKIIKKHFGDLFRIEALLFGTAGLLKVRPADAYQSSLKKEYSFLSRKYNLKNDFLSRHQWKFMRTRPGNFPTLRIGQLAAFLNQHPNLFSFITGNDDISAIIESMEMETARYWTSHYDFGKIANRKTEIGRNSLQGLVINTCIPVLGAYSIYMDDREFMQRAIRFLRNIPAEKNRITKIWDPLLKTDNNAAESQSLIQLYNSYCIKKKCLNCTIGMKLLQANDTVLGG